MISGEGRAARIAKLFELERKHDLFACRIDGWSAWRVLRNPLYWLVAELPLSKPGRPASVRIMEAALATFKLARLMIFGSRKDLLVQTCRSALRVMRGEQFEELHFDGLLRRGYSCIKLEEINSPDFEAQAAAAWRPADLNPVVFTFWGHVLGRLLPADADAFCHRVAELLRDEMQIAVSPTWLLLRISTVVWQARLYGLLLTRSRPRAVLVSNTGEYGLCLAAHRHGIRFIEVQHGVFDASQPDAIPSWVEGSELELILPDVLATRGEYWREQLASTRQGRDHTVAVGDAMTDWARTRRNPLRERHGVHLVLTSQGLDTSRLVDWVNELANCAPAELDWRLSVKLHPYYDCDPREFERLKKHQRITVISGGEQPNVFELLAEADLHLTISSTCHFDAAAIGVRSMVIPLAGHELLTDTVDGQLFFLAHAPSEAWKVAATPVVIDLARSRRYSCPGYVDNLVALLPVELPRFAEAERA